VPPDNKDAPWLLYEAGALSKNVDESRVVPLLIGLEKTQITPPLSQFQAKGISKTDIAGLVKDINKCIEPPLDDARLTKGIEKFWPDLEPYIKSALEKIAHGVPAAKRTHEEIAEETLNTVRSLAKNIEDMKARARLAELLKEVPSGLSALDVGALGLGPLLGKGYGAIPRKGTLQQLAEDYFTKEGKPQPQAAVAPTAKNKPEESK